MLRQARLLLLTSTLVALAPAQTRVIEGKGLWPNLTLLADGTITVHAFNQPSHGSVPGAVDCWASTDGGATFAYRGTPEPNAPGQARMNCAVGLGQSGDLLVLISGWADPGRFTQLLPVLVCRSGDGGVSWTQTAGFPKSPSGSELVPYGDLVLAADGSLLASAYDQSAAYLLRSADDGRTWSAPVLLADGFNETALLALGGSDSLAAARSTLTNGEHVGLLRTDDGGGTFGLDAALTQPQQHPAHLLRLADGRVLAAYGDRRPGRGGIEARLSGNGGGAFGDALRLVNLPDGDLGYPDSVQRADGRIVTAYYSDAGGYHAGVVIWDPPPITLQLAVWPAAAAALVEPAPGLMSPPLGSIATLRATDGCGSDGQSYAFVRWEGDVPAPSDPFLRLRLDATRSVRAVLRLAGAGCLPIARAHRGSTDPFAEGFIVVPTSWGRAGTNVTVQGGSEPEPHWRIATQSNLSFEYVAPLRASDLAHPAGWTLRLRVRVDFADDRLNAQASVADGRDWWVLTWLAGGSAATRGAYTLTPSFGLGARLSPADPAAGFQDWELRYDPASDTVTFVEGGVAVGTQTRAQAADSDRRELRFGDDVSPWGTTSDARYARVELARGR